jgi:single-strand DNA-binding protein
MGRLTADPEIKTLPNGNKVANFTLAVTKKWKDKNGERKEKTNFPRIRVWNSGLISVLEKYVRKGDVVIVRGEVETGKYEKEGQTHYTTDIVLQGFGAEMQIPNFKKDREPSTESTTQTQTSTTKQPAKELEPIDDDIPF